MANRRRRKLVSELNVVPYIDVMLVLLVIFMVTAPMITASVNVDLPQSKAQPAPPKDKPPVIVQVGPDGQVTLKTADTGGYIDVDISDVGQQVKGFIDMPENTGTQVYVAGDAKVPYEKVILVMGALSAAGIDNVGLMSQSEQ